MSDFAKWLREVLKSNAHEAKHGEDRVILWDLRLMVVDLAELTAQLFTAAEEEHEDCLDCEKALSCLTKDALKAAEEFQEKYEHV